MQIIRNDAHVKSQQRRGRLLTTIGFVALAGTFVMVWLQRSRPELILLAYALMLFGFIFFNMGLQIVGKFLTNDRKKRAHQLLDRALDRLNDRFAIIHYAQVGKRAGEHQIVHTGGVLVITMREIGGKIIVNERRWRRGGNPLGRFFNYSGPQLGNPSLDNEADVAAVKALLTERGLPNEVQGVVVFTNPLAEVSGSAPATSAPLICDPVTTIASPESCSISSAICGSGSARSCAMAAVALASSEMPPIRLMNF